MTSVPASLADQTFGSSFELAALTILIASRIDLDMSTMLSRRSPATRSTACQVNPETKVGMSFLSICRAAHPNTRCTSSPGQAPHRVQDHSAVAMPLPLPKSIARSWHPVLNNSNCRMSPAIATISSGGELESFLVSAIASSFICVLGVPSMLASSLPGIWPPFMEGPDSLPVIYLVGSVGTGKKSIADRLRQADSPTEQDIWQVDTRYYTADVRLQCLDASSPAPQQEAEALVLVCSADSRDTFQACTAWQESNAVSSEIQLCVLNKRDLVSAEGGPEHLPDCQRWCQQHSFELVEVRR